LELSSFIVASIHGDRRCRAEERGMAIKKNGVVLRHVHALFNIGAIGTLTDGQLLERFAAGSGEARELAFAALVERHGPFVLRICRAVLGNEHEADDAFQATFLALVRKAESLLARDSLGPWLHQAAYRAACHDRSARARRRSHEHAAALRSEWQDRNDGRQGLEEVIHEEINRLPARNRVAVVLCDLEGRTLEQAARHLGCAVGTVKSRLSRGREKLRSRLVRRGIAPASCPLTLLASGAAGATVPAALAETTVRYATGGKVIVGMVPAAVAARTEGVLISMFLSNLKAVAVATAVAASLAAGVAVLAQQGDEPGRESPAQSVNTTVTYEILVSHNGRNPRSVAIVNVTDGNPIRVETTEAVILIQPKTGPGPEGVMKRDEPKKPEAAAKREQAKKPEPAAKRDEPKKPEAAAKPDEPKKPEAAAKPEEPKKPEEPGTKAVRKKRRGPGLGMMGGTSMGPRKRTTGRTRKDLEPGRSEEGREGQETGRPKEGGEAAPGAAIPASDRDGTGAIE
jgi:RNA polymerase sigma factor (sigma-70 family)